MDFSKKLGNEPVKTADWQPPLQLRSNAQSNERPMFLANSEGRNGQTEFYTYRWIANSSTMVISRCPTSYERAEFAYSDLQRGPGPTLRILDLYVLRAAPFEQVELILTPISLSKPSFTSTLGTCPKTNCNNTYVYRRNQSRTIEISLADVNQLQVDFWVDFAPPSAQDSILIEFESRANLDIV